MKPGDWICNCGYHVFHPKTVCDKCGEQKPSSAVFTPSFGDWTCSCGTINKRVREQCFKCNKPSSEDAKDIVNSATCLICYKNRRECAIIPCGHFSMCFSCSNKNASENCPICRSKIKSILKIYY